MTGPAPHPRFPAGCRVRVEPAPEVRRTPALLGLVGRAGTVVGSRRLGLAVRLDGGGVWALHPAAVVRAD